MAVIFVGGINGVGKTTLAHEACRKISCRVIDGSFALMKELGISGNYEALRNLGEDRKGRALERVISGLAQDDGVMLFTGHFVKVLSGEISPSRGSWYRHCSAFVLIEGSPRAMAERIRRDEDSKRRAGRMLFSSKTMTLSEQELFLAEAQRQARVVAQELSREFSVPCHFIFNAEGCMDSAVETLCRIAGGYAQSTLS